MFLLTICLFNFLHESQCTDHRPSLDQTKRDFRCEELVIRCDGELNFSFNMFCKGREKKKEESKSLGVYTYLSSMSRPFPTQEKYSRQEPGTEDNSD